MLPLIVYFHGGAFILFSASSTLSHDYVVNLAAELRAVIISIDCRLASEHRLPAEYDNAMERLREHSCQVGLRSVARLQPITIRGLILRQPFFGETRRSASELRLVNDFIFLLCIGDLAWELALPIGVDREREFCNATVGGGSKAVELIGSLEWRVMVTGLDGDLLFDRRAELAKMFEAKGVKVAAHFGVGEYHAVEINVPLRSSCSSRLLRILYVPRDCLILRVHF